jgi:hypothetical protein
VSRISIRLNIILADGCCLSIIFQSLYLLFFILAIYLISVRGSRLTGGVALVIERSAETVGNEKVFLLKLWSKATQYFNKRGRDG